VKDCISKERRERYTQGEFSGITFMQGNAQAAIEMYSRALEGTHKGVSEPDQVGTAPHNVG
jgi:hypothetical protein